LKEISFFYLYGTDSYTKLHHEDSLKHGITIPSGYVANNGRIYVNGTFVDHKGVIADVRFINCDMTKIPLDCDFNKNANCDWWSQSTRFASWQYARNAVRGGYLTNKNNHLAEIRSPLQSKPSGVGICMEFEYLATGTNSNLQVSKMNYGANNYLDESIIWTSKNSDKWIGVRLDIKSDRDFDIGFVSSANDGEVAIDNVTFKQGACELLE